jgi:hypothetical protein
VTYQSAKPRESAGLIVCIKQAIIMENPLCGIITSINIQKIKSIVLVLVVIPKPATKALGDIGVAIIILLFIIVLLICGRLLRWMKTCGKRAILLRDTSVIAIVDFWKKK